MLLSLIAINVIVVNIIVIIANGIVIVIDIIKHWSGRSGPYNRRCFTWLVEFYIKGNHNTPIIAFN